MTETAENDVGNPVRGILLACCGYSLFATQDAMVKWMVADYSVPQILFMRSMFITVVAAYFVWRNGHPSILKSPHRGSVVLRATLMFVAWLCFYTSSRHLGLAEITTLYFSAPLAVVVLSIVFLKEKVSTVRWMACIVGFAGVLLAAYPTHAPNLVPAALALFAGLCWACSTILVRLVSRTESTVNQMMATSFLFALACAVTLPWLWRWPTGWTWLLMLSLGAISALGQFLLYEGFRYAPASALAPMEYTGLVWAFSYGFLLWSDIPALNVFAGAILIVSASLFLLLWEKRQHRIRKVLMTRRS